MPRKKKFVLENVMITHYAAEGKCIAKHQDKVIFIEGGVPGDLVNVFIHKNKKDWAEGKVSALISASPQRSIPFCEHFGICGGCKWQMLPYELQLQYKEQQVKDQLQRIGRITPVEYLPIKGAVNNKHYRNKLDFTFSNKQYLSSAQLKQGLPFEKNVLGFHAPGFFDKVIDIETCYLQNEPTNAIKNFVRQYAFEHELSFYDIKKNTGLLRNLMIRLSSTQELMVVLVFAEDDLTTIENMMLAIREKFPEIHSLSYIINKKLNDTIYDQEVILYSGKAFIEEKLEDFVFKISAKSFFQTNTKQAEVLYTVVRNMADAKGHEILYDLYCGTGSIGIFLSKNVTKIIGVETVPTAIEDAQYNAERNKVQNAYFFAGDVIDVCTNAFFSTHGKPDIIILDPPRAGCHEKLIRSVLQMKAPKVVYVSCNPATQARDLAQLSEIYDVVLSQAVDMFPHTHHVENVVKLELKK